MLGLYNDADFVLCEVGTILYVTWTKVSLCSVRLKMCSHNTHAKQKRELPIYTY
jgi:hypothetical protein